MAAELGCSPESLLDLDLALFNETANAVTKRRQREAEASGWTQDTELLATAVELMHAQLVAFIKANSKDSVSIDPLRIPRPGQEAPEEAVVSNAELMARFGGGG